MEKDHNEARARHRKNLASIFGVEDYSVLEQASGKEKREIIARARRTNRIKRVVVPNFTHSGNPYIMLNRKMNNKGKPVND